MFDLAAATNKIAELERTVVTNPPTITEGIVTSYDYGLDPVKALTDDKVPAIVHKATGPSDLVGVTQTLFNATFTIESRALLYPDIPGQPNIIEQHTGIEAELWGPLVALFMNRQNTFDLCTVSTALSYTLELPENSFIRIGWPVNSNNVYWGFRYLHKFTVQNSC